MKEVTRFFDGVTMPETCAEGIRQALETGIRAKQKGYAMMKKPTAGTVFGTVAGALACLGLLVAAGKMTMNSLPETAATTPEILSLEELEEEVRLKKQNALEKEVQALQEEYRQAGKTLSVTLEITDWLTEEYGELYFCQEAERIHWEEITDKISAQVPYTYSELREDGTVLFLAIGGEYDALRGLKSVGWYSGIWDGETWTVRGEGYEGQRWFTEKVGEAMEKAPAEAMKKAAAKKDFEDGLTYTEGRITYSYSRDSDSVRYNQDCHTPFTDLVDGRVYFIANGEKLDITGQFSQEEPFTYIFTDRHLLTHYIAIGGTPENPGWVEQVYQSWAMGLAAGAGGAGGFNTWNNETDARYGWETRAKEIFEPYGVYWVS